MAQGKQTHARIQAPTDSVIIETRTKTGLIRKDRPVVLSQGVLQELFRFRQDVAANMLVSSLIFSLSLSSLSLSLSLSLVALTWGAQGVSLTSFKIACRKLGIGRWPYTKDSKTRQVLMRHPSSNSQQLVSHSSWGQSAKSNRSAEVRTQQHGAGDIQPEENENTIWLELTNTPAQAVLEDRNSSVTGASLDDFHSILPHGSDTLPSVVEEFTSGSSCQQPRFSELSWNSEEQDQWFDQLSEVTIEDALNVEGVDFFPSATREGANTNFLYDQEDQISLAGCWTSD
ncbi:hypothetical protein GUITHDRAFT_120087 [Guillardia theta CCMP2712]|uniref:RWP-RK domain-containing protein n=1 Tax=Guillardia theta (strain CCMP2712) TaxID=905079 RepID=L1IC71_GUITC|nr:hypothetical protein GUITHDRAFT_120087 [Guillardia theta CCMP2712]EKX33697.1 hypothetical protein GUITHDRAFT_120087 [Guillardia theta CCMP2712]|eukprot:XP_005820677.1 hypothetical protein GUITHDRAFT_120087 [Guillardia theta CCMP2712]